MSLAIPIPVYGRIEEKASEYLSSTNIVKGVDPAELYEQDKPVNPTAFDFMVASQNVLAKDWDTPEEDEAWAYLTKVK
jgi:hypothetical protein